MKSIKYEYKVWKKGTGNPEQFFRAGFRPYNLSKTGKVWQERGHLMNAFSSQVGCWIYRSKNSDGTNKIIREFFEDKMVYEYFWDGEGSYGCNCWSIETFVEKSSSKYKDIILEALRTNR